MHEILGSRFAHREGRPGWHRLANKVWTQDEKVTAREAMVAVAGDVQVVRAPMFYEVDGVRHPADHVAIVRRPLPDSPELKVLGVTSESWVAASYAELAGALDKLSETYPVETAGLLKEGGLAFLCLRAPDWSVKGDEMRSYFAANYSLTPGQGHRVFHSPVRVECWNTNTMAQGQATINLSVPHTSDALQKIELAANLVAQFKTMQERTKSIFESFADLHVSRTEAEAIFLAAYPNPAVPPKVRLLKNMLSETEAETFKRALTADLLIGIQKAEENYARDCETAEALRRCAYERYEAFEPVRLRGTAWAAYNAVTEVSDWREGRGADLSLLTGTRAQEKGRAYAAAMSLVAK